MYDLALIRADMAAALNEERYKQLVDYLKGAKAGTGSYPDLFSPNQRRGLRQQAENFEESDGTLFHTSSAGTKLCRVVVGKAEKDRLMKACHSGIDGGHFGRDKMTIKVYYSYLPIATL